MPVSSMQTGSNPSNSSATSPKIIDSEVNLSSIGTTEEIIITEAKSEYNKYACRYVTKGVKCDFAWKLYNICDKVKLEDQHVKYHISKVDSVPLVIRPNLYSFDCFNEAMNLRQRIYERLNTDKVILLDSGFVSKAMREFEERLAYEDYKKKNMRAIKSTGMNRQLSVVAKGIYQTASLRPMFHRMQGRTSTTTCTATATGSYFPHQKTEDTESIKDDLTSFSYSTPLPNIHKSKKTKAGGKVLKINDAGAKRKSKQKPKQSHSNRGQQPKPPVRVFDESLTKKRMVIIRDSSDDHRTSEEEYRSGEEFIHSAFSGQNYQLPVLPKLSSEKKSDS